MFQLIDRVAVVTGSSRGIGRAVARTLAGQGAKVVVNYVAHEESAAQVVNEIVQSGGVATMVKADVKVPDEARALIEKAAEMYGRLDILVNNAGITRDTLILRMSDADWDEVLTTNLKGAFNCIRAAAKVMVRQRYGRIISISSVSGLVGNAGQANYSAAKAGLHGLSKAVARELASRGITVNVVAPGFVDTDLTAKLPEELKAMGIQRTLLGRMGRPEEIAAAVAFLASEEAGFITGQILAVDGGLAL